MLSKHHAINEHSWNGGECGFHQLKVCSCGKCDDKEDVKCEGTSYTTKHVLKCKFHHLCYQMECELRAQDATVVIHPELGRGHSNLCEAHFTELPKFRIKDQSPCRYFK